MPMEGGRPRPSHLKRGRVARDHIEPLSSAFYDPDSWTENQRGLGHPLHIVGG